MDQFVSVVRRLADEEKKFLAFFARPIDELIAKEKFQFDHRRNFRRQLVDRQQSVRTQMEARGIRRRKQFEANVRLIGDVVVERLQTNGELLFGVLLHELLSRNEEKRFRGEIQQSRTELVQVFHFDRQFRLVRQRRRSCKENSRFRGGGGRVLTVVANGDVEKMDLPFFGVGRARDENFSLMRGVEEEFGMWSEGVQRVGQLAATRLGRIVVLRADLSDDRPNRQIFVDLKNEMFAFELGPMVEPFDGNGHQGERTVFAIADRHVQFDRLIGEILRQRRNQIDLSRHRVDAEEVRVQRVDQRAGGTVRVDGVHLANDRRVERVRRRLDVRDEMVMLVFEARFQIVLIVEQKFNEKARVFAAPVHGV